MAGSTTAGGWGWQHQQVRARYKARMQKGEQFTCPHCGGWINPALRDKRGLEMWDLDHTDDRTAYRGPAHRSCNRRAAAIKRNRKHGSITIRW